MNEGRHPGTRFLLILTMTILLAAAAFGQTGAGIEGKWRTQIEEGPMRLVFIIELSQDAATGQWSGLIRDSRAPQESRELQALGVIDHNVRFHVSGQRQQDRLEFDLQFRPSSDELRGKTRFIAQGQQVFEIATTWTRIVEQIGTEGLRFQPSRPFIGAWSAQPDRSDRERAIVLEILPDADEYHGTLTDTGLDQTAALRDLVINDRQQTISFNFRLADASFLSSFWGRYDQDRDSVRGSMSIGGRSQALSFERTSPGPESLRDEFATTRRPLVRKHETHFAAIIRGARWSPLYILKDKVRNINDITTPSFALDAGLRFHLLDYLALQGRIVRGGVGFDTNARNLGLFDPNEGPQGGGLSHALTTNSFLKLDSYEFSIVTFLGQGLFPQSRFNPYIIAVTGRTTWELTEDARGSQLITLFEVPLSGTDWTFGGGLGTEYAISRRFGVELEWVWAYTTTEDATKWLDIVEQWTSQHIFRVSLGGIFWF